MRTWKSFAGTALVVVLAAAGSAPARATAVAQAQGGALSPDYLDQLLAPVALHPDPLLAQILLCSGNPSKVGELSAWLEETSNLKGSARQEAAQKAGFEPSFVALAPFPQVVELMAGNLKWTSQLGGAFAVDRGAVFDSIQRLRAKSQAAPTTTTVVVHEEDHSDEAAVAGALIGFAAGVAMGAAIHDDTYYGPYGWHGGVHMYNDAWDDYYDNREDAREDYYDNREDAREDGQDHREDMAGERSDRAENAREQRTERQQARSTPEGQAQREQRRSEAQGKAQQAPRGHGRRMAALRRRPRPEGARARKRGLALPGAAREGRGRWSFDAAAGREEILDRRIGRNELAVIAILRTCVGAQRVYARAGHDGRPAGLYARRLGSDPGTQNGLYWPAARGERLSPLGELIAQAADEGYRREGGGGLSPFHGYYFRILEGPPKSAKGGAADYVVDGEMSGGFALVAWPVHYGASGVMTFVVNQEGVVYEKDLGPETEAAARAITRYDPDDTWPAAEASE